MKDYVLLIIMAISICLNCLLAAQLKQQNDECHYLYRYYVAAESLMDRLTECDFPEFYDTTGESDEYCDYFVALKNLERR